LIEVAFAHALKAQNDCRDIDDEDDDSGNNGGPVEGDGFERIDLQILEATVEAEYTIPNGGGNGLELPKNLIAEGDQDWNKWL